MYTINLHTILLSEVGTMEDYEIELEQASDVDFQLQPNQFLDIQLTKIDIKGVSLFIPEQIIKGIAKDAVSLEEVEFEVKTFPIERRFYTTIPEEEDPEMVEKINTSTFEVDIEPIINEAVFLNIPYSFHKDPKAKPTEFSTQSPDQASPFAQLKDKNT